MENSHGSSRQLMYHWSRLRIATININDAKKIGPQARYAQDTLMENMVLDLPTAGVSILKIILWSGDVVKFSTVKLHKRGPLLQTAGHPFPLLLGQPSSALLSTAQAGGPPSVKIGWATKTIIFEDVRGHKMTSFFTCKYFG